MTQTDEHRTAIAGRAWVLDPERSNAQFSVPNLWGLAKVRGRFSSMQGGIAADGRVELRIDAASLHTGNPIRDRHLRGSDFFDVEHHPQVSFSSAGLEEAAGGGWRLPGLLQAAGASLRLDLAPSVEISADHLEIEATTEVDQHRLGMTLTRMGIRTPALLRVRAWLAPEADLAPAA